MFSVVSVSSLVPEFSGVPGIEQHSRDVCQSGDSMGSIPVITGVFCLTVCGHENGSYSK